MIPWKCLENRLIKFNILREAVERISEYKEASPERGGGTNSWLGGVDGGPWAVGGGLEVRLFFLGLFGESGEPPVPGLKSAVKLLLLVTAVSTTINKWVKNSSETIMMCFAFM